MKSILYVSCRRLEPLLRANDISDILTTSRIRNVEREVTGALIVTILHFAQILEGPEDALTELLGLIQRDHRHFDVRVVSSKTVVRRDFVKWSLAHAGESSLAAGLVEAAIKSPNLDIDVHAERIRNFILMLA